MSRTPRFATNLISGLFRRLRTTEARLKKANWSQRLRSTFLNSSAGEKLEQRLALAVSVLEFPTGGSTDWATVLVSEGSDAYVKAVATAGQDPHRWQMARIPGCQSGAGIRHRLPQSQYHQPPQIPG